MPIQAAYVMIPTLRERRRQQTARDIQLAALRLCLNVGYGHVTTESIAAEAGVSPRTFFNYYHNKQAAILGELPELDCVHGGWPVRSKGSLVADLGQLVGSILDEMRLDRDVVCMIQQVCHDTPELTAIFHNSMNNVAIAIGGLLEDRLGPDQRPAARLIAQLTTGALSGSIRAWAADETMTMDDITSMVERTLAHVETLLR